MNTLGLGRAVNSLQLGKPGGIIAEAWRDIKEFTLKIRRVVEFTLER